MNVQRDPDAILAAWLEEGPIELPEATRRAIAVHTRTTNQRRRPAWMPQRRPSMNLYARWAIAAIAIVVSVGGALYLLAPAGGQVGETPTDLASWIPTRPGVTVIGRKAVQVGGVAATQLDTQTGAQDLSFGPIPGVTDPGLGLGANWTVRLFVVPVDGRQVVIILHAE